MGFEYRCKDQREAEKLQKAGGHLTTIKAPATPFEPKTYVFSETYNQAKKILGEVGKVIEEKIEEVKEEITNKVKKVVNEEVSLKEPEEKKGKGGKK